MKSKMIKGHEKTVVFLSRQFVGKKIIKKRSTIPVMSLHVTAPAAPRVIVIKGLAKNAGTIKAVIAQCFFSDQNAHKRMREHVKAIASGYQYKINLFTALYRDKRWMFISV